MLESSSTEINVSGASPHATKSFHQLQLPPTSNERACRAAAGTNERHIKPHQPASVPRGGENERTDVVGERSSTIEVDRPRAPAEVVEGREADHQQVVGEQWRSGSSWRASGGR